jgi:hypothetical protein
MKYLLFGSTAGERPISAVPKWVMILLGFSIIAQLVFHGGTLDLKTHERALPKPPSQDALSIIGLGDNVGLSKFIMLWLQGFDHQPGISIPFSKLNYETLIEWLGRVLVLDPRSSYALLSASRIYSEVPDVVKKRKMLEFVYEKFLERPNERWIWMAHAAYVAKHRIDDSELALKYARQLRLNTTSKNVPNWARQLELFVYEDLGDLESAQILLGGLIESGEITDENEIKFLMSRLSTNDDIDTY